MKVARRVSLGYGVLLALSGILILVQVTVFRNLQEVNRKNSGENLLMALTVVDLLRDSDALKEISARYFVKGDTGSWDEMKEGIQRFEDALRQIRDFKGSVRESEEVARLQQFWQDFKSALTGDPAAQNPAASGTIPDSVRERLDTLRAQLMTVYQAVLQDIRTQAEDSRKSGERTEMIALWIGGATLLAGLLLAYLTVRSVSIPLRLLCEGTRGIAEGKSFYRLDTSRNDELSQIAKDFNTLAEKLRGGTASTEEESERQL